MLRRLAGWWRCRRHACVERDLIEALLAERAETQLAIDGITEALKKMAASLEAAAHG